MVLETFCFPVDASPGFDGCSSAEGAACGKELTSCICFPLGCSAFARSGATQQVQILKLARVRPSALQLTTPNSTAQKVAMLQSVPITPTGQ